MNQFAHNLKHLREEAGLRRVVLAELCDLGKNAIQEYETGDRVPGLDAAIKIADFFGVSLDYLAGRESDKIPGIQGKK